VSWGIGSTASSSRAGVTCGALSFAITDCRRSLSQFSYDVSYSPIQTNITKFPYATCDNDLGHSPLRLRYESTDIDRVDGSVTYCWSVKITNGTQCDTNPANRTCCEQDLAAIEFEISKANESFCERKGKLWRAGDEGSRVHAGL
jgi:hypothetical protein